MAGAAQPMSSTASPVLEARDLVKDYTSDGTTLRALNHVSAQVERGQFLAIMGPSGSGKSTLLHLLGALDTPSSGQVLFEGRDLSRLSDKERTLIRRHHAGFVFQFFNLVPVLTVEENVALPLVIDSQPRARIAQRTTEVLELVGIAEHRAKLPSQLSGGEQQRAAIARALVASPTVLLADEPTGNLDSQNGMQIMSVLKDTQRDLGQTIVLVTHDPQVASFGDAVLFLRDGAVVEQVALPERSDLDHGIALDSIEGAASVPRRRRR